MYGKELKLKVGNLDYLIHAIDCVKSGFRDALKKLKENGQNYFIIKRGLDICIVPCVCGMGKAKMIIIGILIVIAAVILAVLTAGSGLAALTGMVQATTAAGTAGAAGAATAGAMVSVFSAAAGLSTLAQIGIAVSMISLQIGIQLIVTGLTMQKPPDPEGKKAITGGTVGSIASIGKSYLFSNNGYNQAVQGKPVPIGYGRMVTAGKIINLAVKSYPTTSSFSIETNALASSYVNI